MKSRGKWLKTTEYVQLVNDSLNVILPGFILFRKMNGNILFFIVSHTIKNSLFLNVSTAMPKYMWITSPITNTTVDLRQLFDIFLNKALFSSILKSLLLCCRSYSKSLTSVDKSGKINIDHIHVSFFTLSSPLVSYIHLRKLSSAKRSFVISKEDLLKVLRHLSERLLQTWSSLVSNRNSSVWRNIPFAQRITLSNMLLACIRLQSHSYQTVEQRAALSYLHTTVLFVHRSFTQASFDRV